MLASASVCPSILIPKISVIKSLQLFAKVTNFPRGKCDMRMPSPHLTYNDIKRRRKNETSRVEQGSMVRRVIKNRYFFCCKTGPWDVQQAANRTMRTLDIETDIWILWLMIIHQWKWCDPFSDQGNWEAAEMTRIWRIMWNMLDSCVCWG